MKEGIGQARGSRKVSKNRKGNYKKIRVDWGET